MKLEEKYRTRELVYLLSLTEFMIPVTNTPTKEEKEFIDDFYLSLEKYYASEEFFILKSFDSYNIIRNYILDIIGTIKNIDDFTEDKVTSEEARIFQKISHIYNQNKFGNVCNALFWIKKHPLYYKQLNAKSRQGIVNAVDDVSTATTMNTIVNAMK
jgi:hypothetical protein